MSLRTKAIPTMFGLYAMLEAGRMSLGFIETGRKVTETLLAAGSVIDRRSRTIGSAIRDPARANHRELARMVTEKQTAFGRSGQVLVGEWLAWQLFWADEMARLSAAAPFSPADPKATADGIAAFARLIAAPGKALEPVHAAATGNARRLGRRRRAS